MKYLILLLCPFIGVIVSFVLSFFRVSDYYMGYVSGTITMAIIYGVLK